MGIMVELRKGEGLFLGGCFVVNKEHRPTRLYVDGSAPVLRERDAMTEERADSAPKRLYLAIQKMYLEGAQDSLHELYLAEARSIAQTAPRLIPVLHEIESSVTSGKLYKALREARPLFEEI